MKNNDEMQNLDLSSRHEAINILHSYIVQAPAGSGKTELLTQRYLRLLAHVEQPEEILAITFTRKAAHEMHERILKRIENKNSGGQDLPKSIIDKLSERERVWNLSENPHRLRIQTIDSFCFQIASRLPTLSHFGAAPEISEHPYALYEKASENFLFALETNTPIHDDIYFLLKFLKNDRQKLRGLLIDLLRCRDQWLPQMVQLNRESDAKTFLEASLKIIIEAKLKFFSEFQKSSEFSTVCNVLEIFYQENLLSEDLRLIYQKHYTKNHFSVHTIPIWQFLCELLLTQKGQWRKRWAGDFTKDPQLKNTLLPHLKMLSEEGSDEFALQFDLLRTLPNPSYPESSWKTLSSLLKSLPRLAAELTLVFQQAGKVDYLEISIRALEALTSSDTALSLSCALDATLKHILIDEFQDTSTLHFRLIEQLIADWSPHDGKTLFLVGDPMQSIYRFRKAEVNLFIRLWEARKFLNLPLKPLSLFKNYRSQAHLISWFNQHFNSIFPKQISFDLGAVPYTPATAHRLSTNLHPEIKLFASNTEEAEYVAQKILDHRQIYPDQRIAVLARARSHLTPFIAAFRRSGILFHGNDIDSLMDKMICQDLFSLTRALLHPADRIAWLSVLRAPWCGLLLSDLLTLSHADTLLWTQIKNHQQLSLSDDAHRRLTLILPSLEAAHAERGHLPLRHWVEKTWHRLKGPLCLTHKDDFSHAEKFFQVLERFDSLENLPNYTVLETALNKEMIAMPAEPHSIEISTMHKAKGLEYDFVILIGLASGTRGNSTTLLKWSEITENETIYPLLAPLYSEVEEEGAPLYQFIQQQEKERDQQESARLFYVACTRAREHLLLTATLKSDNDSLVMPSRGTHLSLLWEHLPETTTSSEIKTENTTPSKHLRRLTLTSMKSSQDKPLEFFSPNENSLKLSPLARQRGILMHHLLKSYAETQPEALTEFIKISQTDIQLRLRETGLTDAQQMHLHDDIFSAFASVLQDAKGQWILAPHQEHRAEWPFLLKTGQSYQAQIIDRTFLDEQATRWIIDYKTTEAPTDTEDLGRFLERQKKMHETQLINYAQAFLGEAKFPICLGLYYPFVTAWISWEYKK